MSFASLLFRFGFLVAAIGIATAGCAVWRVPEREGRLTLPTLQPTSDSVALEVFRARFPLGQSEFNDDLWQAADEQRFAPELRLAWARQGLRVGVVGTQLPARLARLLKLSDKPVNKEEKLSVAALSEEPEVMLNLQYLRAGELCYLVAPHVYDRLALLLYDGEDPVGRMLTSAQGRFALRAQSAVDGQVRLNLAPEIHHGEPRSRWIGSDGAFRLDTEQAKEVFPELKFDVTIAPGEFLLLTCLPERRGSVGYYLFTEPAGEAVAQKLWVLRPTRSGEDRQFAASD